MLILTRLSMLVTFAAFVFLAASGRHVLAAVALLCLAVTLCCLIYGERRP